MPISKRNRRGLLLLLCIAALISYTPRIIAAFSDDDDIQISFEELEKIEEFDQLQCLRSLTDVRHWSYLGISGMQRI